MDKSEVKTFLEFCHELALQRKYAFYLEKDSVCEYSGLKRPDCRGSSTIVPQQ